MFDTITCKIPLPLPEDCGELKNYKKWDTLEFQTKDLQNYLGHYTIREDDQLYEARSVMGKPLSFWDFDPAEGMSDDVMFPCNHHGVVNFYTQINGEKYDYWLEYKVIFTGGFIEELSLVRFKEEDNSDRLTKEASFKDYILEQRAYRSTIRYKIYNVIHKI